MNAFVNYLLEANIGLCLFLLLYWMLLKHETDFTLKRAFLLVAIVVSLIFPLFHFTTKVDIVPALGGLIPSTWLPEVVVYANETPHIRETHINFDIWLLTRVAYMGGVLITTTVFATRLLQLFKIIRTAPSYPVDKFTILESPRDEHTSFSFFNFIFIGKSAELSEREKSLIIEHERIHAQQLHSFDVLLMNVLGVVFWFNPFISIYKKIFVHLHEYEADARSVKSHDVNDYCSLLAKVALLSADIRLANHFSNTLTLKRIEMMRKISSKIKPWKIALISSAIPIFFVIVSCQDQLVNDVTKIARNTNMALDAPTVIAERFDAVKKANPGSTYILVEFNEHADKLLAEMEKAHGIPASIELFTPDNERYKNSVMNTEPEKITFHQSKEWETASELTEARTFAIIEYNDAAKKIATASRDDNGVYTIVDETAVPESGIGVLMETIAHKIAYPAQARRMGVEGKVFVEFVVHEDGTMTDIKVVKGIGAGCDNAAVVAVKGSMVTWIPGKVNGVAVKQRMVMPVSFKLANTPPLKDEVEAPENTMEEMVVVGQKTQ